MRERELPTTEKITPVSDRIGREIFPGAGFVAERNWEGVVLEATDDSFRARLSDKRTGRAEAEAEIYRSMLCSSDNERLTARITFDWAIGHWNDDPEKRTFSYLRLRDLRPLTAEDLEQAERRAATLRLERS